MDDFLDGCPAPERALLGHYVEVAHVLLGAAGHQVREVTSYQLPALAIGPSAKQVVCAFAVGRRFCS